LNKIDLLLKDMFPGGVQYKHLWEITIWDKRFNEVDNFKQPRVNNYKYYLASDLKALASENGYIKLLTTNKSDLWTSREETTDTPAEGEIVAIPWGGNPIVQYYNGMFFTADNRIATAMDENELDVKYLYHYLNSKIEIIAEFYRGSGIKHPSMEKVLDLEIPLPPINVQRDIVSILDNFNELIDGLKMELEARTLQYDFYRRMLLEEENANIEYQLYTLGSISKKVSSGSTPLANNPRYYEDGKIPWLRTQEVKFNEIFDTEIKVTNAALEETSIKWIPENCVIIAISGATAGRSAVNKIPLTTNQHCCNFEIDPLVADYRYVYHWVASNYEHIKSMGQGVRSDLNAGQLKEYPIRLPSLPEQIKISELLDKFNLLTKSDSCGIPAEIAARQRQFEYYRNKIMSFEMLGQ
jgi:type I restriction enzyme S subunit